jgi:hypothetical protein
LDNTVLEAYFCAPAEHIKYQKAHCYAGFYRFKEFGDYQASGFPISLKWEARLPLALCSLRILQDAVGALRSRKKYRYGDRNETLREYAECVSDSPVFDGKRVRKLLSENRIYRSSIYKMRTLAKFFDVYVAAKTKEASSIRPSPSSVEWIQS